MGCGASVKNISANPDKMSDHGAVPEVGEARLNSEQESAGGNGHDWRGDDGHEEHAVALEHTEELETALARMVIGKDGGGFQESRQTQRFAREGGGDWNDFVRLEASSWWVGLHGMKEKNRDFKLALMDCQFALANWPRGDGPGELLITPQLDHTPVRERGVTAEWCAHAFEWLGMHAAAGEHTVSYLPTRIFVTALIKLLTARYECSLYAFIPQRFRGKPTDFISHSWDCTLRSLFYHHLSECRWLDFVAVNQHHPDAEVGSIGDVVKGCCRTIVVMEGMDELSYALRPVLRSWCIFEIMQTPPGHLQLQIGIYHMDVAYHQELAASIGRICVQAAEAQRPNDKEMIDDLVLRKYATWEAANAEIRLLVLDAFAAWYLTLSGDNTTFGHGGAVDAEAIAQLYRDQAVSLRGSIPAP